MVVKFVEFLPDVSWQILVTALDAIDLVPQSEDFPFLRGCFYDVDHKLIASKR